MTDEDNSVLKDRLFYATNYVCEAISRIEKIQEENIGYDPTYQNWVKHGHKGTRKRTLKDAKDDARNAVTLLRKAWDILDPHIK